MTSWAGFRVQSEAKTHMDRGMFVPDEMIVEYVRDVASFEQAGKEETAPVSVMQAIVELGRLLRLNGADVRARAVRAAQP